MLRLNIHTKASSKNSRTSRDLAELALKQQTKDCRKCAHVSLLCHKHLFEDNRASCKMSKASVQRMLRHDLKLYRYLRLLQKISDEDCAHCASFCKEMIFLLNNNLSFLNQLLFSDEACFHLSKDIISHNIRYQASENPKQCLTGPLFSQCMLCGPIVSLTRFFSRRDSHWLAISKDVYKKTLFLLFKGFFISMTSNSSDSRMGPHPNFSSQLEIGSTDILKIVGLVGLTPQHIMATQKSGPDSLRLLVVGYQPTTIGRR